MTKMSKRTGRPPMDPSKRLVLTAFRLSPEHKQVVEQNGGVDYLRRLIDADGGEKPLAPAEKAPTAAPAPAHAPAQEAAEPVVPSTPEEIQARSAALIAIDDKIADIINEQSPVWFGSSRKEIAVTPREARMKTLIDAISNGVGTNAGRLLAEAAKKKTAPSSKAYLIREAAEQIVGSEFVVGLLLRELVALSEPYAEFNAALRELVGTAS